jgi:molybdopterin converting factor small subunit
VKLVVELTKPFSDAVGAKVIEDEFEAADVNSLIRELAGRYPRLKDDFFEDNGEVGLYISIFLNDKPVTALDGLDTSLSEGDRVIFLMPISGG